MEAFFEDHSCGLTQKQATHIDLNNLSSLTILLNTVASVIELGEGSAELIEVITEDVWVQVVCD